MAGRSEREGEGTPMHTALPKMVRTTRTVSPGLLIAGFLLGLWLSLLLAHQLGLPIATFRKPAPSPPPPYTYSLYGASNGVRLHALRTSPANVELRAIATNVTDTNEYGMNGGFFWNGDLLSIAVIGDRPLKGQPHDYGSGWTNIDVPKGTLVWDEASQRFSIQVTDAANRLQVTDRKRYWAQGGVSMSLNDEAGWRAQARKENMPVMDAPRLRSAAVYDRQQALWMIVSDKPCTVEAFRTAIRETIAPGQLVDGIFLDGDGSSQMRSAEVTLRGDTRAVYQMMALKNKATDR